MSKMCIKPVTDLSGILQGGVRSPEDNDMAVSETYEVYGRASRATPQPSDEGNVFAFSNSKGGYHFARFKTETEARLYGRARGLVLDGPLTDEFYNRIKKFD